MPFKAAHRILTSLRTTPEAQLQRVRDRWSIESWHWIRDTQLHEDAHRYRGKGAGAMATLRTAALNLIRLAGFQSIRAGMQAVTHNITALLAIATRNPEPSSSQDCEAGLPPSLPHETSHRPVNRAWFPALDSFMRRW